MRIIDPYKLLGVIVQQDRRNVPDFVYKSIKNAPTIDIDSIIAEHENIGYEKGLRDGYAEAVDTKSVRHGHWIKKDHVFYDNYRYECSECHHYDEHSESREVPYCWHCGALMDEANDEKRR